MKSKNIFKIFIVAFLISNVFVNIKVYQSSSLQAYLLYDFNNDSYQVPYEIYNKLDYNFPNLTQTALPIKILKARYLLDLDSVSQAKSLLFDASKANPYIMAAEDMLAKIYLQENNLDSAYLLSKVAFNKLLNEGVIVRSLTVYKMPNYLRVSIGLPEENQTFLEKIKLTLS